jgi:hypothetical protein
MKFGRFAIAAMLAVSAASFSFADDAKKPAEKTEKKFTEGSCCDKAQKAGKECAHKCCVEAAKKDEVCTKCNKPAKDAK